MFGTVGKMGTFFTWMVLVFVRDPKMLGGKCGLGC